jgi:hypothetical protein
MADSRIPKNSSKVAQPKNRLNEVRKSGCISHERDKAEVQVFIIRGKNDQSLLVNKKKVPWPLIVITTTLALLSICCGFPSSGANDVKENDEQLMETGEPMPTENLPVSTESSDEFNLSEQQLTVVNDFGWPDSFTITEIDNTQGEHIRHEIWVYYQGRTSYVFLNGLFISSNEVEELPQGYMPTPFQPDQFQTGTSLDRLQIQIGESELLPLDDSDVISDGVQLYFGQQLIIGFMEDRLVYVEALAFIPEGSE